MSAAIASPTVLIVSQQFSPAIPVVPVTSDREITDRLRFQAEQIAIVYFDQGVLKAGYYDAYLVDRESGAVLDQETLIV